MDIYNTLTNYFRVGIQIDVTAEQIYFRRI